MKRREFVTRSGSFVASASLGSLVACSSDHSSAKPGTYAFPQGVASGDPTPNSVMLWTRAVWADHDGTGDPIALKLEVSESNDFDTLVLVSEVTASDTGDFTVRILIEKLQPSTTYYYRFLADSDQSRVGRTRTAPEAGADVTVRFAWASCQDYTANYYGAYRQMINDDKAAKPDEQLDFVMFIGDFIYETYAPGSKLALDDDLVPTALVNSDGKPRTLPKFPDSGKIDDTVFALTVDDYRLLYRNYLLDPDLQEARARWPFVTMWDDHEFSDDCWQTQANYDRKKTTDEPSQPRRVAASQAWAEYIPTVLSEAEPVNGVTQEAHDFEFVQVEKKPYTQVIEVTEPNNVKAISAITAYRSLRFGKHMDLVLTDNRSYRSDQPIPEDVTANSTLIFAPRNALPIDAVRVMDAGKTANNGNPPAMVDGLENIRKGDDPGSMLGKTQKEWWKKVMQASDATFRIWGNSVPLLRFRLDSRTTGGIIPQDLVLADDAWDGYNSERKELMAFLKKEGILNVISVSGDHHAHYAGVVYDDYDAEKPVPVMVDLCAAGIASSSQFSETVNQLKGAFSGPLAAVVAPIVDLLTYDATKFPGGTNKTVVNLNTLIRYGGPAAQKAADTNNLSQVEAARDPTINPHLRYADSNAWGYGLASVGKSGVEAKIVTVKRSFKALGSKSPGVRCSATFNIKPVSKAADIDLPEPTVEGEKPFPLA